MPRTNHFKCQFNIIKVKVTKSVTPGDTRFVMQSFFLKGNTAKQEKKRPTLYCGEVKQTNEQGVR